jgi:hypothetical protein
VEKITINQENFVQFHRKLDVSNQPSNKELLIKHRAIFISNGIASNFLTVQVFVRLVMEQLTIDNNVCGVVIAIGLA